MRKHHILTLLCLASSACGQDSRCPTGKVCSPADQCQEFVEKKEVLRSLTRGSTQYKNSLSQLKRLVCNKEEKKVCCTQQRPTTTTAPRTTPPNTKQSSPSWVPSKREGCGFSSASSGFIVGGNDTELGEFPWTVLLGKTSSSGRTQWKCGGTLVNKWYVVTAAHCKNSMDMVRVGEWEVVDTSQIKTQRFGFNCTAYSE